MSDKDLKIKQFGLTIEFSGDVDYHMKDKFTTLIEDQIADGVADAAAIFEKNLFLAGSHVAEDKLIRNSPHKKPPHDEKLLPIKDGWCVGYIREWNFVDIYHKHGTKYWSEKWHYAEKGECPECHAKLPSEMWTAINLLVEL